MRLNLMQASLLRPEFSRSFPDDNMNAERLHAKLMLEAAQNEERLWYQERLDLAKAPQPESKSAHCMRRLRDLRSKTNDIEWDLDVRRRIELEAERHLRATMALREANMTAAEKQARAEETRRGQILLSRIVPENHPDWREQENPNLAFYRQQIAPVGKRNAQTR
jgi:hypothetical protein